jgi:hypothetical protein
MGILRRAKFYGKTMSNLLEHNNWKAPTGEARRYETPGSYVSKNGFGHEEWLFNFQWLLLDYDSYAPN